MVNSNQDGSITYFGGNVLYSAKINGSEKTPTPRIPSREELTEIEPVAIWGEMNDFPTQARELKESNPDLVSALDWKARALYAGGISFEITDRSTGLINENNKKLEYEIETFLFQNRHYLLQAAIDFYDLYNVFPQIILSEDRTKIKRIACIEARACRFEKRHKNGDINFIYIHPEWEEWSNDKKDPFLKKVQILHALNADPETIKKQKGETMKYMFPVAYPTGRNYYQHPHWYSIVNSKWLDFGNMIPEMKQAIMKNLSLIRYHIQMPDYWMPDRYKNWITMNDKERKEKTEAEFKIINEVLTGPQNAGKSIYTMFKTMSGVGKEFGGWKIEAVDDKMKDGALLADSSEATIKIFSATSIDPSLHGLIPGKGGSNRSGSDKREALNIYMSLIQAHEDILLDPFHFAAQYNNWNNEDTKVSFRLKKPMLQTLNEITPSKRETKPNNAD